MKKSLLPFVFLPSHSGHPRRSNAHSVQGEIVEVQAQVPDHMHDLSKEIPYDMLDELHGDLVRFLTPSQDCSEPTSHCVCYALCHRDLDVPAVPSTGYHSIDGGKIFGEQIGIEAVFLFLLPARSSGRIIFNTYGASRAS